MIPFREIVKETWATLQDARKFTLFGELLADVKRKRLWRMWGHKTFFRYCRDELNLKPSGMENMYIALYERTRALGLYDSARNIDLHDIERAFPFYMILDASKRCKTQHDFLLVFSGTEAAARRFLRQLRTQSPRQRNAIGPWHVTKTDYEAVDSVLSYFKKLGVTYPKGVVAMALLVKSILEKDLADRWQWYRKQLMHAGITGQIADILLTDFYFSKSKKPSSRRARMNRRTRKMTDILFQ